MAKAQISIVAGNIGWLEWMTGIQRQAGGIPFFIGRQLLDAQWGVRGMGVEWNAGKPASRPN